jgi:transcription initiation factor TFIIE subunit alpha
MQIKLLKDVVSNVAGKPASDIVDLLFGKRDINEFIIAKKLKLTINQTRNILYKLSNFGLVSFIRKKDKRKGWYIYFWTLNISKSLEFLKKAIAQEMANLESQLKARENKRFFICKVCHIEVSEEKALENNFTCGECGEVYEFNTDKKVINELSSKINFLKKNLEAIEPELAKASLSRKKSKPAKKIKAKKTKKASKKPARKK